MSARSDRPATPELASPPSGQRASVLARLDPRNASNTTVLLLLLVLLCVFFWTQNSVFATGTNIQNLASQSSVLAMMAAGQLFVVLAGGLDLSVGAQVSLLAICAVKLSLVTSLPVAMLLTVLIGCGVGLVNGVLVARMGISPIIATLATWQVVFGSLLVWTHGLPSRNFSEQYNTLGSDNLGPIPVSALLAAAVVFLAWFILRRTSFGRYTYAIGGNAEAARLSGINISAVTIGTYVICSAFTALAALTLSSRVGSGVANLGTGLEVTTLAAVFIGGVAWAGGAGTAGGVLLGALLLSVLSNGFDLMSVSSETQTIITGVLIAGSVGVAGRRRAAASA
ncbi:MAG: ribose transport system permease protein [Thermoleophilaceae bacterium]|nr:ribose transport system permease protein [Thermoleophilaceae bacterium]